MDALARAGTTLVDPARAREASARAAAIGPAVSLDGRHLRLSPPDRFSASDPSGARHTFRALRLATRSPIGSLD